MFDRQNHVEPYFRKLDHALSKIRLYTCNKTYLDVLYSYFKIRLLYFLRPGGHPVENEAKGDNMSYNTETNNTL